MPETTGLAVYVVDDDAAIRDALALLLGLHGHRCVMFACGEDFLAAWKPEWSGCALVDLRLPGIDGLEVQRELQRRGSSLPVVIITGHGDVAAARAAFMAQAVDFLEKPFDQDSPLRAIESAFAREAARLGAEARGRDEREAFDRLTDREREVALLVAEGLHNRAIAERLGISPRTVEIHKARVMEKLEISGVAELVRIAMRSGAA